MSIPAFVRSLDGKAAIIRRQCTREYKLTPIQEEVRDLMGLGFRESIPKGLYTELWIGISTDEVVRMKPSREKWIDKPMAANRTTDVACRLSGLVQR